MRAFKTELEVLKRLKHRHMVEYFGSYTDPSYLGLVMSPVADGNLCNFLAQVSNSLDKKSLLRSFFGCLSYALAYLHSSQIWHKDIKPQNILVKGDNVLFTDFGVFLDWTETSRSTTQDETILTQWYCAPEVAEFEPRGSSSDIWSLGCVFLEMLTVLKGETLDDMRAFYEVTGSQSQFFRSNPVASEQWMLKLEQVDRTESDNPPLAWEGNASD
jgi:serine/threonine protein kinase